MQGWKGTCVEDGRTKVEHAKALDIIACGELSHFYPTFLKNKMAKLVRDAIPINQVARALTIETNDIFQLWIPTTFIAFKYDLT
jgi:hypothetical protein